MWGRAVGSKNGSLESLLDGLSGEKASDLWAVSRSSTTSQFLGKPIGSQKLLLEKEALSGKEWDIRGGNECTTTERV